MKNINISLKEYEITKSKEEALKLEWYNKNKYLNSKDIDEVKKINTLSWIQIFEIKPDNRIKAKQYVWIMKINNKNIQILPKIFWDKNEDILKNLLYMLSYTKKLKIKESDIASLWKINDLFEIFIYIFSKELIELLKKDFKKNYSLIEENSGFLKWKLLFSKHIKNNLFNKSKFFIEYENMDENILLNLFLKSICQKLLKQTKSKTNYKLLKKCDFILKDIDYKIFKTPKELNRLNFNRQNKKYKNIFSLWKMLYFWNSPDFSQNIEDNFSILFDMNILFEEFIVEFMKKNKNKINKDLLSVNSQLSNKYVFINNKFNLRPDIILNYKDNKKIIIDTKYKKIINEKNKNYWVSSWDIYQMFMYWMRYFENNEDKKIILLYPEYFEKIEWEYISEENINIFIKTINMNFNLSWKEWKDKLVNQMLNFCY